MILIFLSISPFPKIFTGFRADLISPFSFSITGCIPYKGSVAEPGLRSVTPGNGEIRMPPVSVCHQVSSIGHFCLPTTL